jgi:predicted GTPase
MKLHLWRPALFIAVMLLPYALLVLAGCWWFYERGYFFWWALGAAAILLVGGGLLNWSQKQFRPAAPSGVEASPAWAPESEPAWRVVEEFSARVRQQPLPLDNPQQSWILLLELLESVARCYHPKSAKPLLETPVAHITKIVEWVAHDLSAAVSQLVPGSRLLSVKTWLELAELANHAQGAYVAFYRFYRWIRLAVNPPTGLARELAMAMEKNMTTSATLDVKESVVDFVVRRAGHYAIELYSGHVDLDGTFVASRSRADFAEATSTAAEASAEPLRIMIVGQVSAGKSSLVNALFGEVKAATDILPTTQRVTPLVFQRAGFGQALIFDTAGYGGAETAVMADPLAKLHDELLSCDLVLLVCSATSATRAADRRMLDAVRREYLSQSKRRPPPLIVALTHVDLLRPFAEWSPPYDLAERASEKARQIAAAVECVATDLDVDSERVIPLCLAPERLYNVEESFVPAIIECLPEATRAKALRCLGAQQNEERWLLVWRQTLAAGRVLRAKLSRA